MIRGMKGVIAPVLRIVRSITANARLRIISVKPKTRYSHLFKVSITISEISHRLFLVR